MKWAVRYRVKYPDMVRDGHSDCASQEAALDWVRFHSGKVSKIVHLEVIKGSMVAGTWKQNPSTGKLEKVVHVR